MNIKTTIITIMLFCLFSAQNFAADYCKNRTCNTECKKMGSITCMSIATASCLGYAASIAPTVCDCICCSTLSGIYGCTGLLIPAYDIYNFYKLRQEDTQKNDPTPQPTQIAMQEIPTHLQPKLHPGWNRLQ